MYNLTTKQRNARKDLREELKGSGETHLEIVSGKIVRNVTEAAMAVDYAPD